MRLSKLIFFAIFIIFISSCAPTLKEIELPPGKIFKAGYGFIPFNEPGWIFPDPNNKFKIELVKQGPTPNSTYAIQIWPEKIPLFEKNESFYDYAKSNFLAREDDSRFEIVEIYAKEYENEKAVCTELHLKVLDKNPVKREKNSNPMILENHGFMCQHPETKDVGYFINFSHRHHENEASLSVEEMSHKVFNNLNFIEFYY
jgi:hypothetical protein